MWSSHTPQTLLRRRTHSFLICLPSAMCTHLGNTLRCSLTCVIGLASSPSSNNGDHSDLVSVTYCCPLHTAAVHFAHVYLYKRTCIKGQIRCQMIPLILSPTLDTNISNDVGYTCRSYIAATSITQTKLQQFRSVLVGRVWGLQARKGQITWKILQCVD